MSAFSKYISTRSSSLWSAYSQHRQAVAEAKTRGKAVESTATIFPILPEAKTAGDTIKDFFVSQGSWILPFVIAGLLAVSSGYLFANFHDFSWSAPTYIKIAYIGGGCLEGGALMGVFSANRNLKQGNKQLFFIIFSGVVFFSLISALAQYVYLDHTVQLDIHDANQAPIFNYFVGFGGADGKEWLFFLRSITFHTLEIFCTFLFSRTEKTIAQLAREHRMRVQAEMEAQREIAIAEVSNRINEIVTSAIGDVGKMVDLTMTNALLNMKQGSTLNPQLTEGKAADDTSPLVVTQLQPQSQNGKKGK
ncbi:MAG: hypothetical protein ACXVKK_10465 [Flavisolibacter sp.]